MGETTEEARMNVAAVKRVDPYARDIVDSATHVALYTFEGNEWEKTSIEGALFVYSRTGKPFHSMVIMNRLNINNLIEPVSEGLELQVQEPFLLYRNSKRRIYGIWFYDKDECSRVAARINGLCKETSNNNNTVNNVDRTLPPPMQQQQGSVDIFSMLSKAQVEYNTNKGLGGMPSKDNLPQAPRPLDVTSQSVMDFFAKAGGGGKVQLPGPPPQGPIFGPQRPPPDTREGPMLLQRLMSNPVHSVEHIEKQQRSVTPGESTLGTNKRNNLKTTSNNKNLSKNEAATSNQTQPVRILTKLESNIDSETNGQSGLDLCFMRVGSPKSISPLSNFINQSQQSMKMNDEAENKHNPVSQCETPQKPALMPPTMFTSSASKAGSERPTLESMLTPIRPVVGTSTTNDEVRPEPLTRNQLLQAFNYLIKNDADFVNKLHEAYVKSFSELVS